MNPANRNTFTFITHRRAQLSYSSQLEEGIDEATGAGPCIAGSAAPCGCCHALARRFACAFTSYAVSVSSSSRLPLPHSGKPCAGMSGGSAYWGLQCTPQPFLHIARARLAKDGTYGRLLPVAIFLGGNSSRGAATTKQPDGTAVGRIAQRARLSTHLRQRPMPSAGPGTCMAPWICSMLMLIIAVARWSRKQRVQRARLVNTLTSEMSLINAPCWSQQCVKRWSQQCVKR